MLDVKTMIDILSDLNPDASVTVAINGALFDVGALGVDAHRDEGSPRVSLQIAQPYRYGRVPTMGGRA